MEGTGEVGTAIEFVGDNDEADEDAPDFQGSVSEMGMRTFALRVFVRYPEQVSKKGDRAQDGLGFQRQRREMRSSKSVQPTDLGDRDRKLN
jgi:hypothetical protein